MARTKRTGLVAKMDGILTRLSRGYLGGVSVAGAPLVSLYSLKAYRILRLDADVRNKLYSHLECMRTGQVNIAIVIL